jgi:hypothetical protein
MGVVMWDKKPSEYAEEHPIAIQDVRTQDDIRELVGAMLRNFKHFIEDQRGWSLLFNSKNEEKPEEAAQLLFLGMSQHYL